MTSNQTAHYNRGNEKCRAAFVFSCPGNKEKENGRPVSGITGTNLDKAILVLNRLRPDLFPFVERYEYRITNAHDGIQSRSETGKTEATDAMVAQPENLARLAGELKDMDVVVVCGNKAQLALGRIDGNFAVAHVCHIGGMGLAATYNKRTGFEGSQEERIERWAKDVLSQVS